MDPEFIFGYVKPKFKNMDPLRKKIKDAIEALPNGQFKPGLFAQKVGYKYVTFINTHGIVRRQKMSLVEFEATYFYDFDEV